MSGACATYDPPRKLDDSRICGACLRGYGSWEPVTIFSVLNTRTGKYHASRGYGVTDCGRDATGEEYLWPI